MSHIVEAITTQTSLADCYQRFKAAHDYLAQQGRAALEKAWQVELVGQWGSRVKRIRVELPNMNRPVAIPVDIPDHNLIEVINQCATLERLLDTLLWAQSIESGLSDYQVVVCHPTTSSDKNNITRSDNDLILVGPNTHVAKFEISDVASSRDSNRKEKKDLVSLGVLETGRAVEEFNLQWPQERLFLVVSEEFAKRLRQPTRSWLKGTTPFCRYNEFVSGSTRIFEIKPGMA